MAASGRGGAEAAAPYRSNGGGRSRAGGWGGGGGPWDAEGGFAPPGPCGLRVPRSAVGPRRRGYSERPVAALHKTLVTHTHHPPRVPSASGEVIAVPVAADHVISFLHK